MSLYAYERLAAIQKQTTYLATDSFPAAILMGKTVVIPETFFFRHPEGIGAFQQIVRQTLFFSPEKIRVLSLPCSTGEEPYSLAISLLALGLNADRFGIDASDMSEHALQTARAGVFGNHSFRGTDGNLRARYFEETDDGARLEQRVRDCVRFTQGNVVAENFRFGSEPYHFVFCRNLLIYFDEKTQGDTLGRLEKLLAPGGLLFVGPAEAGLLINHGFVSARLPMAFGFYRRKGAPSTFSRPVRSKVPPRPNATSTGRPLDSGVPGRVSLEPATFPLEQAGRLADQGRLRDASELCESLLRTTGPSAALFYLLALIRDGGGSLDEASRFYRKALYLDPDHYQAAIHLALLNERPAWMTNSRNRFFGRNWNPSSVWQPRACPPADPEFSFAAAAHRYVFCLLGLARCRRGRIRKRSAHPVMDALDYAEIAERPLEVSTPTSRRALLQLAAACRVRDGTDVLDIGTGHGLLLRLWARHWAVRGTGVDRSAEVVEHARRKAEAEGVSERVRFVAGEAAEAPVRPEGYDVVTCVGASFALGGFAPAVAWMAGRVRPGGVLAVGELFLVRPVPAETLRREQAADLRTREDLLEALGKENVRLLAVMQASAREWDRYCVSSWRAVAAWVRANPLHPDRVRLEREADTWRQRYRRFARNSVSWAFFVAERDR